MAKLSARGRTEVHRMQKESPRYGSNGETVRTEVALMSDNNVLLKMTYLLEGGKVDYSTGWKSQSKIRKGTAAAWRAGLLKDGFTEVTS